MAKIRLTCPECAEEIRFSARPPKGKRVKCPECGHAFFPEIDDDDDDDSTRVQEKPRAKPSLPRNEDNPDEDERDRPTKKRKKRPAKSGSMMYVLAGFGLIGGGGVLLSCCLCGLGAFVWPGFLVTKNELLVFVSPDATLIAGGSPKQLKEKSAAFNDLGPNNAGAFNNQKDLQDLMQASDKFVLFVNTNDVGFGRNINAVLAFKASPAEVARFRASKAIGAAKTVQGQTFHVFNDADGGFRGSSFVAFPSNQVVVIADFSEERMAAALNRAQKGPAASSAALDLARSVEQSPFWVAYTPDGNAKTALKDLFEKGGRGSPAMRDAAPAIAEAKGFTLTMDITRGKEVQIAAAIKCQNSADAVKVKAGLVDGWDTVKGLMKVGLMAGGAPAGMARPMDLMMRDLNGLAFSQSGDHARAAVSFSGETIEELAKVGRNFPGGFALNQPPPQPPPFNPPPFNPPQPPPFNPPQPPPFNPPQPPPFNPPPPINPQGKFNPALAIQTILGAKGVVTRTSQLGAFDARNAQGKRHKLYAFRMEANRTYQIDLISNQFDTYLYLRDDKGLILFQDDDGGGNLNSRIVFRPTIDGMYYIDATSLGGNSVGNFTLTVRRT